MSHLARMRHAAKIGSRESYRSGGLATSPSPSAPSRPRN